MKILVNSELSGKRVKSDIYKWRLSDTVASVEIPRVISYIRSVVYGMRSYEQFTVKLTLTTDLPSAPITSRGIVITLTELSTQGDYIEVIRESIKDWVNRATSCNNPGCGQSIDHDFSDWLCKHHAIEYKLVQQDLEMSKNPLNDF